MSPQALSDERPASASARAAEGWERRFVADRHRAAEAIRLYRELGFEVVADPLEPDAVGSVCGGCRIHTAFQVIYTRRPAPNPDADGAAGVSGNRPHGEHDA